jgi:hypothetical protein
MTQEETKAAIEEMAVLLEHVTKAVALLIKGQTNISPEARPQVIREVDALLERASTLRSIVAPRT